MLNTINQYNELKDSKNLVFSYKGAIDEELIASMLAIIENKLGMVEYNSRLKKKIFNIIVELIQNVFHNYQENEKNIPLNIQDIHLMVVKRVEIYEIICGNYMLNTQTKYLERSIKDVNELSEEGLRQRYVDRLENGIISSTGRAGLGLMDMARKSGNKLEYCFDKYDEQLSLFSLKVNVNINL
ncbi:MAG: hypothetical protein ACI9L9_000484 [Marivirga sp.]|jgi:hypothetical protein